MSKPLPQKSCCVSIRVDPIIGSEPLDVFHEMVRLATELRVLVEADLNGVLVVAAAHSEPKPLYEEWSRRMAKASLLRKHLGSP